MAGSTLNVHLESGSRIRAGVVTDDPESEWVSLLLDDMDLTIFGTVEQLREVAHVLTVGAIRLQLLRDLMAEKVEAAAERNLADDVTSGNVWPVE